MEYADKWVSKTKIYEQEMTPWIILQLPLFCSLGNSLATGSCYFGTSWTCTKESLRGWRIKVQKGKESAISLNLVE